MLDEDLRQPLRLVAKLPTYRLLGMGRQVSLREQQIEDRLHGGQPRRELLRREIVGIERKVPEPSPGATESFVYVRLGDEEARRDLANVETAQRLQRDHELRLDGDRVVAADEQH